MSPAISPDAERERLTLRNRLDCVTAADLVRRRAEGHGWSARAAGELELITLELCANAVKHGGGGHCEVALDSHAAQIEVGDSGPGFPSWVLERHARGVPIERASPHALGGLGAGLDAVGRLASELVLAGSSEGARAVAVRIADRSTTRGATPWTPSP